MGKVKPLFVYVGICCNDENGMPTDKIIAFDFDPGSKGDPFMNLEAHYVDEDWNPEGIEFRLGRAFHHRRPRSRRSRIRRKWRRRLKNWRFARKGESGKWLMLVVGNCAMPVGGHGEHGGNWCWDMVAMRPRWAARLANYLRKTGKFDCSEGVTTLFRKWKTKRRFTQADFIE